MVQVLPTFPTFGEKLIDTLTQAGGRIGEGLLSRQRGQLDQQILNQLASNPEVSPLQQIQAFGKMSPQAQQTLSPLFTHLIDLQKNQSARKEEEALKAQQEHEDVAETINSLADELMEGKVGKFNQYNKLTSKGRESRAYFDELGLAIEKRLANMVGKGALSKVRFDYLKKNLPSSGDTDATNRGRLRALAKEFKVDIENPAFQRSLKQSEKESEGNPKVSLEEIFK
jgi:hypothetical protein